MLVICTSVVTDPFSSISNWPGLQSIDTGLNIDGLSACLGCVAATSTVVFVMAVSGMSTKLLSAISIVIVSVATPLMVGPSPVTGNHGGPVHVAHRGQDGRG